MDLGLGLCEPVLLLFRYELHFNMLQRVHHLLSQLGRRMPGCEMPIEEQRILELVLGLLAADRKLKCYRVLSSVCNFRFVTFV